MKAKRTKKKQRKGKRTNTHKMVIILATQKKMWSLKKSKMSVREDFKNKLHIGENATPLRLKAKKRTVFKNKTPKRGKAVEKDAKKEVHVSEIAKV
ncbi:hypothetical protein niasHT_032150 [Heterodera trifolii]|uniref:Uncharacterized protein n=1 Tax=Heterodera trifolii TaxID=157864 RepID=A0ABD2HNN6_9BILA